MESAKGRKAAVASLPGKSQQPLGVAAGTESHAAFMPRLDFLAAVQQLADARLEVQAARAEADKAYRAAYVVCSRMPPFLGLLCALFPEHEFHVYDPAPGLSARPYGQGRREVPAWLYRHELLWADHAYWALRGGDTVVFLGESSLSSERGAWKKGEPLVDEILKDQCQRRCSRCAAEIRTWLAYVRSGPQGGPNGQTVQSLLRRPSNDETETNAVASLMAVATDELRLCCPYATKSGHPGRDARTWISDQPGQQGCSSSFVAPRDEATPGASVDDRRTARKSSTSGPDKTESSAKLVDAAWPVARAPKASRPPNKQRAVAQASEPRPPAPETESPEDGTTSFFGEAKMFESTPPDWERLSAEMLAFSADAHKKAAAKTRKGKRGGLGREHAGVR